MAQIPSVATPAPAAGLPERPSPKDAARAIGVVVGGPLLLDALEILGPVSATARWPRRLHAGPRGRIARWLTAAGVLAPLLDHGLVRPWLRAWGSTPAERRRQLPGDSATKPMFRVTRAVTVHTPAEEVWRWLVQIGQDRGGFYSYDWLENLAGCQVRSADEIRAEWQTRQAGDPLLMAPWMGTRLSEVDPPRALVIENWGAYVIEPRDASSCRLLARSSTEANPAGLMYLLFIELPHAIMERKMLLGLKERAERGYARRNHGERSHTVTAGDGSRP